MKMRKKYTEDNQLCAVACVVLSPYATATSGLLVPSDFSLIREGGETMWKSHELQG